MREGWVVQLSMADRDVLARVRDRPGLEVCRQEDVIWLRGTTTDESLDKLLRTLPGERFEVRSDRQLVPFGCRVPKGYLPEGPWEALSRVISVELEPPAFGALACGKVSLRLVRGGPVREANLLVTPLESWASYAGTAPQVRLDQLTFAASATQDALIRGTPLPPLEGERFVEEKGIATPAGWAWRPSIDPEVLREVFRLEAGDVALFHVDGAWDHVRADDFVRATRSAIRLSFGEAWCD